MKPAHLLTLAVLLSTAACGKHATAPTPLTGAQSAPNLSGAKVVLFPTQQGPVPVANTALHHWPLDRAALDAEISYWLQQNGSTKLWTLPAAVQKSLARSPGMDVDAGNLSVGIFQRARVERIGDPLFGDIRKVAAFSDAQLAVIPVSAEYVGENEQNARVEIATAIIKMDADVLWFGVITGTETGVGSDAAVASAAQAFARAFAPKKSDGEK